MKLEWRRAHRIVMLYRGHRMRFRRRRYWRAILSDIKAQPNYREIEGPSGTIQMLQHPLHEDQTQ